MSEKLHPVRPRTAANSKFVDTAEWLLGTMRATGIRPSGNTPAGRWLARFEGRRAAGATLAPVIVDALDLAAQLPTKQQAKQQAMIADYRMLFEANGRHPEAGHGPLESAVATWAARVRSSSNPELVAAAREIDAIGDKLAA